ncbi:MAG TPA: ATP-binding protein [Planctomycetota bacterium]|nr:ATP-binding protein [Planctomycetota bacterium]
MTDFATIQDAPPGTPNPTTRRRPLRCLKRLEDARLVRAFSEVLALRGARPKGIFRGVDASLFTCAPCLEKAVASLGLTLETQETLPLERGLVEGYRRVTWYFDRVEDRPAPGEDGENGEMRAKAGTEARFYADRVLGLHRIVRPGAPVEDALWIWTFNSFQADAVCLAAPSRGRLRALITALHVEHRDHERRSGLLMVGNFSDTHARPAKVTWDDLVLPAKVGEELRATVKEFFASAELYRSHGIPHRRGILLAGPPGNGKTSILRAIASEAKVPVVVATLDNPNRVHNTRLAFDRAVSLAPAIACFEDLDAMVGDGPGLSQFLNCLDGLEPLEGVLVVATTNRPDRIDPAIAKRPSRFDRIFVIPDPDSAQRSAYLARQIGNGGPSGAAERLARATEGYSVAFLKELVLQARLRAVRRGDTKLADEDLDAALASTGDHLRLASRGLEERGLGFGV